MARWSSRKTLRALERVLFCEGRDEGREEGRQGGREGGRGEMVALLLAYSWSLCKIYGRAKGN
jgi:predicted transposase YdaD